jgi:hypothetical protein
LRFLYKYIADYRFGQMASEVMDVVLGELVRIIDL